MKVKDREAAEQGLRLLSKKHKSLHPRAQVQTLRRIAVRAMKKADWLLELAKQYEAFSAEPDLTADEREARLDEARRMREDVVPLREKARIATEACLLLNEEHSLGY